MREVHEPVPLFNEKILMSVERTLKRFKPEEPFERSSWEIVDDLKAHKRACLELSDLCETCADELSGDRQHRDARGGREARRRPPPERVHLPVRFLSSTLSASRPH